MAVKLYPRYHIRSDGREKIRYSEQEAREAAARINGNISRTDTRPSVESYQCKLCLYWHVGRSKLWLLPTDPTLRDELGERAWWNLYWENARKSNHRFTAIRSRLRRHQCT